jgi:hypothetical protein
MTGPRDPRHDVLFEPVRTSPKTLRHQERAVARLT